MIYRTESIQLASFLACQKKLTFIGVNKSDLERVAFVFEPAEAAQQLADAYFAGRVKVNPLELFEKYRTLRDLIFEAKTAVIK